MNRKHTYMDAYSIVLANNTILLDGSACRPFPRPHYPHKHFIKFTKTYKQNIALKISNFILIFIIEDL